LKDKNILKDTMTTEEKADAFDNILNMHEGNLEQFGYEVDIFINYLKSIHPCNVTLNN